MGVESNLRQFFNESFCASWSCDISSVLLCHPYWLIMILETGQLLERGVGDRILWLPAPTLTESLR